MFIYIVFAAVHTVNFDLWSCPKVWQVDLGLLSICVLVPMPLVILFAVCYKMKQEKLKTAIADISAQTWNGKE